MKQITIKVVVALCTFIIGIIVATAWLVNPTPNVSDITPIKVKVNIPPPPVPEITLD